MDFLCGPNPRDGPLNGERVRVIRKPPRAPKHEGVENVLNEISSVDKMDMRVAKDEGALMMRLKGMMIE